MSVTKGHEHHAVLFSKWNSFSRIGVYAQPYGAWSLSKRYTGPLPDTHLMDIDSAAATQILHFGGDLRDVEYLQYELTSLGYRLYGEPGRTPSSPLRALVIGPGGGRDLLSALVFGASSVDGVEINPIIANDVMRGAFREYSGGVYDHPAVHIHVEDGRSFVRRSPDKYDVIQASLVDTWAATAAGAYTLTENSLYTVEAFDDYLDHLTDRGVLSISRWVFDGLRLVSLAQEACARHGLSAADHLAVIQNEGVATFLLKKTPFDAADRERLAAAARDLKFSILYLPGTTAEPMGDVRDDYARLILAPDRQAFYRDYPFDVSPTTDDRPFFFHTNRLRSQRFIAAGLRLLGHPVEPPPQIGSWGTGGLTALLVLLVISFALILAFIVGPLAITNRAALAPGWSRPLAYFACLGAGFMLIEVALLQRFVLLLGHPVYSLTVTLLSLLLGTGIGSLLSRHVTDAGVRRTAATGVHGDRCGRRPVGDRAPGRDCLCDWLATSATARHGDAADASGGHVDGHPAAGRRATAGRGTSVAHRVGMGHQRRAVGSRRHAGGLHCDELGFFGDPAGWWDSLSRGERADARLANRSARRRQCTVYGSLRVNGAIFTSNWSPPSATI